MARRVTFLVLSTIAFLVGLGCAVAGVALLAVFGADGTARSGTQPLRTPTAALVSPTSQIHTNGIEAGGVRFEVSARSAQGRSVFVGVARAQDLQRYLGSTAVDRMTDVTVMPFRYTSVRQGSGTDAAVPAPTRATFWLAQATGPRLRTVSWNAGTGSYALVVMNADGSAGVDVLGDLGVHLSLVFPVALGLAAGGVLLIVLAVALALRARSRRPVRPPSWRPSHRAYPSLP